METVKLDELKCTQLKLIDTQMQNVKLQFNNMMSDLQKKADGLAKELEADLEGDSNDWSINLDKCEATKKIEGQPSEGA